MSTAAKIGEMKTFRLPNLLQAQKLNKAFTHKVLGESI